MTRLQNHIHSYYTPRNSIVLIRGDEPLDTLQRIVEEAFSEPCPWDTGEAGEKQ